MIDVAWSLFVFGFGIYVGWRITSASSQAAELRKQNKQPERSAG